MDEADFLGDRIASNTLFYYFLLFYFLKIKLIK